MKSTRLISIITATLVFFLASSAFVLSYDALYQTALDNGITPNLAWLWPLTLDAVMIAASLTVLRQSLQKEKEWYAWIIVGLFTVLSVTFNMIHANNTWLSRAVFVLPPIVCFLSFELLVSQFRSAINRNGTAMSLKEMQAAVQYARDEIATLEQQADTLSDEIATKKQQAEIELQQMTQAEQGRVEELQQLVNKLQQQEQAMTQQVKSMQETNGALQSELETMQEKYNQLQNALDSDEEVAKTSQRLKELYAIQPDLQTTVAAKIIGVSRQAIDSQIGRMITRGEMKQNGVGYIVIK